MQILLHGPVCGVCTVVDLKRLNQTVGPNSFIARSRAELPPVEIKKRICAAAGECQIQIMLAGCTGNVACELLPILPATGSGDINRANFCTDL